MGKDLVDIPSVWYNRFLEVAEILKRFYTHILEEYGNRLDDFLRFSTLAEKAQLYPWTYIDYGFRVPVYRTMQWLNFNIDINWRAVIGKSSKRRMFVIDLYKHILKEYTLMWDKILSVMDIEKTKKILSNIIRDILKLEKEPIKEDPGAFWDLVGLRNELKACYVLVDHNKPFLPFSLMQAPITPSYIRPGASSGDLYLFEENLVVDVKGGWFDRKRNLPRRRNLFNDLKNINILRYLYGIRKGIGVVAEDDNHIHLAIYVPWRGVNEPLLHLVSVKLPLLVYMQRFINNGIEPHKVLIQDNKLSIIIINAYPLNSIKFENKDMSLKILGREESDLEIKEHKMDIEGKRTNIVFEIEVRNVSEYLDKYVITVDNTRFLLAMLSIKLNDLTVNYPIIALFS